MNDRPGIAMDHHGLDRIRALIELIGVATITVTHLVSAATAVAAATRRRRTSCH